MATPGSQERRGSSIVLLTASVTPFAAWSIAAGIGLFELARMMGTSVEQIDRTYGHLLPDSIDRARTAHEAFGHGAATAAEVGGELL